MLLPASIIYKIWKNDYIYVHIKLGIKLVLIWQDSFVDKVAKSVDDKS